MIFKEPFSQYLAKYMSTPDSRSQGVSFDYQVHGNLLIFFLIFLGDLDREDPRVSSIPVDKRNGMYFSNLIVNDPPKQMKRATIKTVFTMNTKFFGRYRI